MISLELVPQMRLRLRLRPHRHRPRLLPPWVLHLGLLLQDHLRPRLLVPPVLLVRLGSLVLLVILALPVLPVPLDMTGSPALVLLRHPGHKSTPTLTRTHTPTAILVMEMSKSKSTSMSMSICPMIWTCTSIMSMSKGTLTSTLILKTSTTIIRIICPPITMLTPLTSTHTILMMTIIITFIMTSILALMMITLARPTMVIIAPLMMMIILTVPTTITLTLVTMTILTHRMTTTLVLRMIMPTRHRLNMLITTNTQGHLVTKNIVMTRIRPHTLTSTRMRDSMRKSQVGTWPKLISKQSTIQVHRLSTSLPSSFPNAGSPSSLGDR
jgi:hypothetical protein